MSWGHVCKEGVTTQITVSEQHTVSEESLKDPKEGTACLADGNTVIVCQGSYQHAAPDHLSWVTIYP